MPLKSGSVAKPKHYRRVVSRKPAVMRRVPRRVRRSLTSWGWHQATKIEIGILMAILKNYFIAKNYKISKTKGRVLNIHNFEKIFIRNEYLNKHGLLPVGQTAKK